MGGLGDVVVHFDQRIIRDPQICGGEPVFKGTRVTLRTVLASRAECGRYLRMRRARLLCGTSPKSR